MSQQLSENKSFNNQHNCTSPPPQNHSQSSESIEKILSSSIQRAKQKITMLEGRQRQERSCENKGERTTSRDGGNQAIASAMKVLQSRVNQLEQTVENHERERSIIMKELDNLSNQKKLILNNLQQSNRKVSVLQNHQRSLKSEVKDLTRQLEEAQNDRNDFESKCQGLEMNIRHLEKDKQQLTGQLQRKQQQMSSKPPLKPVKTSESEQRQKAIADRERRLHEKERRMLEFESNLKEKENKWTQEKTHIKQILRENQHLKQAVSQLQKQCEQDNQKQSEEKDSYELYLRKIKEMEDQISQLRETAKDIKPHQCPEQEDSEEMDYLRDSIRALQDKNQELLRLYKRSEDKAKRQERESKLLKEKVRQLQDLLADMVQKIGKLPTCTKDLKYLTVKAGKIFSSNIEKVTSLKTPTKSRSNSLNRSLSRSASQRKQTQLTNSRTSNKEPSSANRSKRKTEMGSANKSKSKSKSTKRVVVSGVPEEERQLLDLKKEFKRLVKLVNERDDEENRSRLNQIAFAIQQKTQGQTRSRQLRPK